MSRAEKNSSTSKMPATLRTSNTATGPMRSHTSTPATPEAAGLRSRAPATTAVAPGNIAAVIHAVPAKVRSVSSSTTPPTSFHTARMPKNVCGTHDGSQGNSHGRTDGDGPGDGGNGIGGTVGTGGTGRPGGALRMMAPR